MQSLGIPVIDLALVERMSVYIDGADEIDPKGCMIKGGGAALTREKIVAAQADKFVCIADASKNVAVLGAFALPVEVIPMAAPEITRRFKAMGAVAVLRTVNGQTLVTDNGQYLLDVKGFHIADALSFENSVSQWPGVVTVGVFAHQHAHVCLLGTPQGVQTIFY
jgi:ribose 5-phosphate isomerase A